MSLTTIVIIKLYSGIPLCNNNIKTLTIFKFKDILKDRFTSTYNYWL